MLQKGPFPHHASVWGLADGGMRSKRVAKRSRRFSAVLGAAVMGFATCETGERQARLRLGY